MTRTGKYHWGFKLWVKARGLIAIAVVFVGVLVGLATLLLPFEGLYKSRLENFLSEQWDLDVSVSEIYGSWKGFGPSFQLKGLVLKGKQTVEVADTNLSLNVYEWLYPGGKTGINLSISQADLAMVQSEKGHNLTINNDKDEAKFTSMVDNILTTGVLSVSELKLNITDDQGNALLTGLKAAFVLEQDDQNRAMSLTVGLEEKPELVVKSIGPKNKQLSKDAQWHVQLSDLDLSQFNELQGGGFLPAVVLNGEAWLKTSGGVIESATAVINWQLLSMSGSLTWVHEGGNQQWISRFKLTELKAANQSFTDINGQLNRDGAYITAKSDNFDLNWLNQLMSAQFSQWPDFEVKGTVVEPKVVYGLSDASWQQGDMLFEIDALTHDDFAFSQIGGEAKWDKQTLDMVIEGREGFFEMPAFIRDQLKWSTLLSQVSISLNKPQQTVSINQFWCNCGDFLADAQGQYWAESQTGADDAKMLQLQAKVEAVEVSALHKYWPHQVWKPKTIEWLDQGLKSGQVTTGYLFQFGQLVPKAFESGLAHFISRAYLDDVGVKFNPEWPEATNLSGAAVFTGLGFDVDVTGAKSQGINMTSADVTMASYKQAYIDLNLAAEAQGNALFEYLNQTPITQNVGLNENMTLSGNQQVSLKFDVPLQKDVKVVPKGRATFKNAGFSTEHLSLSQLNGEVKIDGFDLIIDDMKAELLKNDVEISGVIQTQTSEGVNINVDLVGGLSAAELLAQQQIDLPIHGLSEWIINITNPEAQLHMDLQSDLVGTVVDLPAPLNKKAESSKFFKLSCDLPCSQSVVALNYGNEIVSQLSADVGGLNIERLLFKKPLETSSQEELLGGYIRYLDIDSWLAQVKQWSQLSDEPDANTAAKNLWPLPDKSFSLVVEDMLFMARRFEDVKLDILRLSDGYQIDIDNQSMKGRLVVADDLSTKGVVADFEYLNWKEALVEDLALSAKRAEKFPDLHIYSENFSYLGIPFGELRLEMRNVIDGMRVETMSMVSDVSNIQISGDWVASGAGGLGTSDFSIVMTSEKIASFLQKMEFDAPISNAQTLIQLYASWPGTPSMFDLKNINGTLNLKMGEGEVLDTKPGFGRVLGLFSLTNLPRRLLLDFKDVMAEGLHFDSMEGRFVLNNGYAETDDFLIKASAANIKVRGLTGFADKSYLQTIIVEPQVGKTFPTLGAIAGGAVGAAAGFFVQGLLNKKLKSSNRISYQVTGTWDAPIIEVIEDE
ncbi:YhdP family protein [Marinicella rhabdoformis]|uniref:YhdP family phospholipid transporter n=1 Tax=Marinicella rhabdoformis TaxID=2580566 RepID=UPI0012AED4BE|nr:AsmA-like C-terminal region-containing protein [Marinicella rhabdoformis]